jgi:hypothetical protein
MLHGTRCHWLTREEQIIPRAQCVRCAAQGDNPCGYALPLIQLMTRDRDPDVVGLSSTTFAGCPREAGLKKHRAWAIDPERAYRRAYGSLVHLNAEALSAGAIAGSVEQRYGRALRLDDGREVQVTAQVDALFRAATGNQVSILDYKTTDTLSDAALRRKAQDYVPQFSIQRWILETAHEMQVTRVDLDFLAPKGHRLVNLYPQGEPEFPRAFLWSHAETEKYLRQRAPALADALENKLPPPLRDPAVFWKCRYCDVRQECEEEWGEQLPAFGGK